MKVTCVRLGPRGEFALPAMLLARYHLAAGDRLTLVDLDGALLLSPKEAVVPKLAAEIQRLRREAGVPVAELRAALSRHGRRRRGPR